MFLLFMCNFGQLPNIHFSLNESAKLKINCNTDQCIEMSWLQRIQYQSQSVNKLILNQERYIMRPSFFWYDNDSGH